MRIFGGDVVTGWTSIIVVVSLLCGVNMLMTGIMGLYVGRIHAEVKRRPLYVVGKRVGFERQIGCGSARIANDTPSLKCTLPTARAWRARKRL